MGQCKLKDMERVFPGKTEGFTSVEERRLQQAALRHYLRGHKIFKYKNNWYHIDASYKQDEAV